MRGPREEWVDAVDAMKALLECMRHFAVRADAGSAPVAAYANARDKVEKFEQAIWDLEACERP